jgi:uncharacterized phiE125 gp8 family phage protein
MPGYLYNNYTYDRIPVKKAFTYNVTTAAANKPLTLDTVKTYLKIPLTDCSQDEFLNMFIDAATSIGELCTGRDFINKTYTTYRDSFYNCLTLRKSKTSSITSIQYLLSDVLTTVATTVYGFTDVNDYSDIFLKEDQVWPTDADNVPQAIKIIFVAGYGADETAVPVDIKFAMLAHIAFMYENRGDCSCDINSVASLPATSKITYDKNRIINIGSCNDGQLYTY